MGDLQRPVQVGRLSEVGRDELRSRYPAQGLKEARIVHAMGDDRPDEIFLVPHSIIMQ